MSLNNGDMNLNDMIGRVLQNPEALGNIMKLAQNFMNNSGQQPQPPPFGVQTPGGAQQNNAQQGGTQQGNMQQGGTQQGNMQQGGTRQGNMQQGGTQQGNMQQGNMQQGGTQQGNMPSPEQLRQFLTQMQGLNQSGGGGANMSNSSPGPNGSDENRVRLLNALRPYLGDGRRQTVDYIIGILKLLEFAGASGLLNGLGLGMNPAPRENAAEQDEEFRAEPDNSDDQ